MNNQQHHRLSARWSPPPALLKETSNMIPELIRRVNEHAPGKGEALFGGFEVYASCLPNDQLMTALNKCYGLNYPVGDEHVDNWITKFIAEILPAIE